MEKIQLEVDKVTAEKWNRSNRKTKKQISDAFEKVMDIFFENKEDDFWPILEGIRKKAENKGFNDEILNEILNDSRFVLDTNTIISAVLSPFSTNAEVL